MYAREFLESRNVIKANPVLASFRMPYRLLCNGMACG